MKLLVEHIKEHAVSSPDKIAVVQENQPVTYGDLMKRINATAAHLASIGVGKGDRVILSASNTPSFLYGYFASHLLGAITAPLAPKTPDTRLQFIIDKLDPAAIFIDREFTYKNYSSQLISAFDQLDLDTPEKEYTLPIMDMVADILFTTGTTGESKGVVLTHHNICHQAKNINAFIGNDHTDVEVLPLPLSHSFGLGRLRCNMVTGGTIVLVDGFLIVGKIFQAFEKWHATGFCFVPAGLAILYKLSADKIGDYTKQLKYIEIGSAPMPMENKLRLMRLLPNTRICMHYGLTEASRSTFIEFHQGKQKLESIGLPTPNVSVKVADKEGNEVAIDELGEILVRGEMVMRDYLDNPEETANKLINGWIRTGDIGSMDKEGYYYLRGREKELINIAGRKAAPDEIENVLKQHKAVEDCACIGVPDPEGIKGETPKAFIVLKQGIEKKPSHSELHEFFRGKLEEYKIPSLFQWIDTIPKTASGKLQRAFLKDK
jgi:acyl-CoA synthetase (AMP-forming)/AMP-acid ligase II